MPVPSSVSRRPTGTALARLQNLLQVYGDPDGFQNPAQAHPAPAQLPPAQAPPTAVIVEGHGVAQPPAPWYVM